LLLRLKRGRNHHYELDCEQEEDCDRGKPPAVLPQTEIHEFRTPTAIVCRGTSLL